MAIKVSSSRNTSSILINNHIHRLPQLKPPRPPDKKAQIPQSKLLCLVSTTIKTISLQNISNQQCSSSNNISQYTKEADISYQQQSACKIQQPKKQIKSYLSEEQFPITRTISNVQKPTFSNQEPQQSGAIAISSCNSLKENKFRLSTTQVFFPKNVISDTQETLRAQQKLLIVNEELSQQSPLRTPPLLPNKETFKRQTFRIRQFNPPSRCPSPKNVSEFVNQNMNVDQSKQYKILEDQLIKQIKTSDEQLQVSKRPPVPLRRPTLRRPSLEATEAAAAAAAATAASKGCSSNHFSIQAFPRKNSFPHLQRFKKKGDGSFSSRVAIHHNQNSNTTLNNQNDSVNLISKSDRNGIVDCRYADDNKHNLYASKEKRSLSNNKETTFYNVLSGSNQKENINSSLKDNSICNRDVSVFQSESIANYSPCQKLNKKKQSLSKQQAQLNAHLFAALKPPMPSFHLQAVNQIYPPSIFFNKNQKKQGLSDQSNSALASILQEQSFAYQQPGHLQNVELRELIGEGAYGKVFKGFLKKTGKFIAVKQLKISQQLQQNNNKENIAQIHQDKLQQYHKEIFFLNHLEHPHIVKYYGCKKDGDYLYIYMEQMTGGSIAQMLSKFGGFDESLIKKFVKQILLGLVYLHSQNFVHRDIKGGNILSDGNGTVKLADFGAARYRDTLCLPSASESEFCNSIKGSLYWMAPELLNEEPHGRKSDIWSLGCTVIEMITAKHPWPECKNFHQLVLQVKTLQCPPIPDSLSEECKNFIQQCCTFDKKARPSAEQLLQHSFLLAS